jgi:uncharacterized protein (TIGR02246 family)
MKPLLSIVLLTCLVMNSVAQTSTAPEELILVANSFFNSWNRHDFSDMRKYSTDDVICVIDAGVVWRGRNRVQSAHENAHKLLMKSVSFTPDQQTISTRTIATDVALVYMVAKMDAFYPPDGINKGNNKIGDHRVVVTFVEVKKNGKWLLANIQGTGINPQAEASLRE